MFGGKPNQEAQVSGFFSIRKMDEGYHRVGSPVEDEAIWGSEINTTLLTQGYNKGIPSRISPVIRRHR